MKPRARVLPALLLALLPCAAPAAGSGSPATDRIIVKWRGASLPDSSEQRAQGIGQRLGRSFAPGHDLGRSMSVLRLASPQRGAQLAATLAALRADPDVELAEADRRVKIQAYTPNDPLFSDGFSYNGQSYDYQWYLKGTQVAAIRADSAWEITHGGASPADSPVVVAVLDTGVRADHPDLAGKLLPGLDFVSDPAMGNDGDGWDADPGDPGDFITAADLKSAAFKDDDCGGGDNHDQPTDSTWHGTRTAALIGAGTDDGVGMAGAAFNVRILPVRVLGKCGGMVSDVIAAMYWAAGFGASNDRPFPPSLIQDATLLKNHPNLYPAQVINLSLGGTEACSDAYKTAVNEITSVGVLIVASAGNEGTTVDEPANCPGVLAVAGIRQAGTKVGYSNLGPEVSIAAPAGNCVLVGATDPCLFSLNTAINLGTQGPAANSYSSPVLDATYGTSFSAPLAAATVGLMKAVNPALTPAVLVARLKSSARAFPTVSDTTPQPPACHTPANSDDVQNTECICTTAVCGAGMLDAGAAVLAAQNPVALAVVTGTVKLGNPLTLDGSASAAASGRQLTGHVWSVEDVSGGATTPAISNANQLVAGISAPGQGSVTLRLTVTDDAGNSDHTLVTITGTGGGGSSSESPPPATSVSRSSGGGGLDATLLLLLALLVARRQLRPAPLPTESPKK